MAVLIGKPCQRQSTPTLIVLDRTARQRWELICFGNKGHYNQDGGCWHTENVLECLKSDWHRSRTKVVPFGGKE